MTKEAIYVCIYANVQKKRKEKNTNCKKQKIHVKNKKRKKMQDAKKKGKKINEKNKWKSKMEKMHRLYIYIYDHQP